MTTNHTSKLLAGAVALLLAGCAATPSHPIGEAARAHAIAERPAAPAAQDFPAIESARWPQGSFPRPEALRAMRPGMGKDQVRDLLGWPHFDEGLFGVREWNYIFHVRTGPGPEFATCQYMVRFNADVLTHAMHWKTPACAAP